MGGCGGAKGSKREATTSESVAGGDDSCSEQEVEDDEGNNHGESEGFSRFNTFVKAVS